MNVTISASVGKDGSNQREDVRKIQNLLNRWNTPRFLPVNGLCNGTDNDQTVLEIKKFQSEYMAIPDGRVDPPGGTLKKLQSECMQLPQTFGFGSGYYQYGSGQDIGARQWGTKKTIETLIRVCKQFQTKQRTISNHANLASYGLIGIGDISFKFGGKMSPHKSHQTGLNVDVRPCRKDLLWQPVTINEPMIYDQGRTKLLINMFLSHPNVEKILFNDSDIYKTNPRVEFSAGHDNHFHITMKR